MIDDDPRQENVLAIVGHSLGATILVSAIDELMLARIEGTPICESIKPFGHAVIAINPALEANALLPLRSRSVLRARKVDPEHWQSKLLHVLSTEADSATAGAFVWARRARLAAFWSAPGVADLTADHGAGAHFDEGGLNVTAAGNYAGIRTGRMRWRGARDGWCYVRCAVTPDEEAYCFDDWRGAKLPDTPNESMEVILTDSAFMDDHNDIFNPNVLGYLATVVTESRYRECKQLSETEDCVQQTWAQCGSSKPDFQTCFNNYRMKFDEIIAREGGRKKAAGLNQPIYPSCPSAGVR